MSNLRSTHVEVYLFRRRGGKTEFLALRRSPHRRVLPGVWQPVTGKQEAGEKSLACAVREVREETGLDPRRWWTLETVTVYFDHADDSLIVLPLFAAEIDREDEVRLSDEHDQFRFLSARKAGRKFLWESQRRGLEAVEREVLGDGALARALEVTHHLAPRLGADHLRSGRTQRRS